MKWRYREALGMLTEDGRKARVGRDVYGRLPCKNRSGIYERIVKVEEGTKFTKVGKVREGRSGELEITTTGLRVELIPPEERVEEVWLPWSKGEIGQVKESIVDGTPCIFSDTSVKGDRKAVAV